ncbi:MAG TPA: hypothetical protein VK563_23560 [Puia sp.]|nr:hypothetical protein [Puia sp.]
MKKKYNELAFRFLLFVLYFFLFAIQLTGKFYTIANFYVYQEGPSAQQAYMTRPAFSDHVFQVRSLHAQSVYERALPHHQHLSLDKRFQPSEAVEPSFGFPGLAQRYRSSDLILFSTCPFSASPDLLTSGLRGPPDRV